MAEHEHGKMDIKEQEETFMGFIRVIVIVTVLSLLALIFMAIVNG